MQSMKYRRNGKPIETETANLTTNYMMKSKIDVTKRYYILFLSFFMTIVMYGQLTVDNFALRVNDQSGMAPGITYRDPNGDRCEQGYLLLSNTTMILAVTYILVGAGMERKSASMLALKGIEGFT